MSVELPWYIARSAGLVAWALLTASVVWGLSISAKAKVPLLDRRPRPNWMLDLHRYLGGLATIFTAVSRATPQSPADTPDGFRPVWTRMRPRSGRKDDGGDRSCRTRRPRRCQHADEAN